MPHSMMLMTCFSKLFYAVTPRVYISLHSKWPLAMWFSMGSNLGFIRPGMSAVNKFWGSKMLYTRSILTMIMPLVISMHHAEQ
jgi:hypothetical protein